jgi:hypothetical protein
MLLSLVTQGTIAYHSFQTHGWEENRVGTILQFLQ